MGISTDLGDKVITRPLYTNYSVWEGMGSLELTLIQVGEEQVSTISGP